MARRRSFIATRLSKMRGIDRSEKELLVSIGQIVDNAVNNRTPTNPRGSIQKAGRRDPRLPPVSNLSVKAGVRSVKISWNPVDGSILENYAIKITNLGTGDTTDNISYTSSFVFKGESGDYKAEVKPIGRNGVAAPVQTIFFTIPDSVMILEGAKNGVSTESSQVSEVVLTPSDYIVFAWTSFVLNSFASPVQNNEPIVQLLYGDALETATLIQSVTMFPESETATNLNDVDYDGILRPAGPVRVGNFETSHTIMFAPFDIPDNIANRSTRFWVRVTNRDIEADVISLSLVLWVGSGGRGELGVTPVATVNPRSIDQDKTSSDVLAGVCVKTSGEMEDNFTLAFWIKPINYTLAGSQGVFQFGFFGFGQGVRNVVLINFVSDFTGHTMSTAINDSLSSGVNIITQAANSTVSVSDVLTNGDNNWNFITLVWDRFEAAADRLKVYVNGGLQVTGGNLTVTSDASTRPDIIRDLTAMVNPFAEHVFTYAIYVSGSPSYTQARFNSMGVWSSTLTASEILILYNDGAGANVDWRTNTGSYTSSADLLHYWLFGLDTTSDATIAKDYGNSLFPINMNVDPPVPIGNITVVDDVVTDAPV